MKNILIFLILIFLNSCSLNKDSIFWKNEPVKRKNNEKKLSVIVKDLKDIKKMTIEEYEYYIDDYTKKSKYPDISK